MVLTIIIIDYYKYVTPQCTCLAARQAYLTKYGDVKNANQDPLAHYERFGAAAATPRIWDCSLCNTRPVYIDDPSSQNCTQALTAYVADPLAWWAGNFPTPLLLIGFYLVLTIQRSDL